MASPSDALRTLVTAALGGHGDSTDFSNLERQRWDGMDVHEIQDVALLIATTNVDAMKIVRLQRTLLTDQRFDCTGVFRLVRSIFHALKKAKKWETLARASEELLEPVYEKLRPGDENEELAMRFYTEILLGYQHSSSLYTKAVPQLKEMASSLKESHARSVAQHQVLREVFILACFALMHIHRGYTSEAEELEEGLMSAFGSDWSRPTADAAEQVLREMAWVLSPESDASVLPSVEGKWVTDEFSSEHHAAAAVAGQSGQQNAGSVLLKKRLNCLAYELTATMEDTYSKRQLNGYIFQALPEMQQVLAKPDQALDVPWVAEGHWSRLYDASASPASSAPMIGPQPAPSASAPAVAWVCRACTMNNEPTATKCATCGTAAPAPAMPTTMTTDPTKGNNPAPFSAVMDDTHSFMRIRWSRGDQQGVWLARRQTNESNLQLASALESVKEMDGMKHAAYSPRGVGANVLVLEKPVSLLSSTSDVVLQVWICPMETGTYQTIVSNGDELEVGLTSDKYIRCSVLHDTYTLVYDREKVPENKFTHVTLRLGSSSISLSVQVDAADVDTSMSSTEETTVSTARTPQTETRPINRSSVTAFVIGGTLGIGDEPTAENVFRGAIVDLRAFSTLAGSTFQGPCIRQALCGDEKDLVGYFCLVGERHNMLVDSSRNENHACPLEVYGARGMTKKSRFDYGLSITDLPVRDVFTSSIGNTFVMSGLVSVRNKRLSIHSSPFGGAVWAKEPVTTERGFQTSLEVSLSTQGSFVFAFSNASYWQASPLIREALALTTSGRGEAKCDGRALFVRMEYKVGADGVFRADVGLYLMADRRTYLVCSAPSLAPLDMHSTSALEVYLRYNIETHTIELQVGNHAAAFVSGLDLETALRLQTGQGSRFGVIFKPTQEMSVHKLSFIANETVPATRDSVIAALYGFSRPSETEGEQTKDDSQARQVACSKSTSDGSAFAQEAYGCQTCNLVHGAMLCRVCAAVCHQGHELVGMGIVTTSCACQVQGGWCRCSTSISAVDHPAVDQPIPISYWCCGKCTVVNAKSASFCSVCGTPPPSFPTTSVSAASKDPSTCTALVPVDSPSASTSANVPIPSEWSCSACTMLNSPEATKCTVCDTPRPASASAAALQQSQTSGLSTLSQAAEQSVVQATPSTSWTCPACTMENNASDAKCFMCSSERPAEALPVATAPDVSMTASTPTPVAQDGRSEATAIDVTTEDNQATGNDEAVNNLQFLQEYKHTVAQSSCSLDMVQRLQDGEWSTTGGKLQFTLGSSFMGEYIDGVYVEGSGILSGLARLNDSGAWKLEGTFQKANQAQKHAFLFQWDRSVSRFDGKWFRGDGSGEWRCVASPVSHDFRGIAPGDLSKPAPRPLSPFYSGLINMEQNLINVCYQNSFLQTLFMTQAFRRLVLSQKADSFMPDESGKHVLQCVQELFSRLIASQRPKIDSHALQRCLPSLFQAGRQQDTSDFAHFLMDALSQQLAQNQETRDKIADVFGGQQATILACKECGKKSVNREYFWELLLNMIDLKYTPITGIEAVGGAGSGIGAPPGFERLNYDLNKERNGASYVYLCIKRSPENDAGETTGDERPITDLMIKVAPAADPKPTAVGFERVEVDLNLGGVSATKKQVYLFYKRDPNGSAITDLRITYNSESIPDGFKHIDIDLNQGDGAKVYLCYRRDTPLTDLQIVNGGIPGYRMVDHLLNLSHEDAAKQYLALKVGGKEPCLTDLKLVEGAQVHEYEERGWKSIGSPASSVSDVQDTEDKTSVPSQLMVQRGHGNPISTIDVFRAPRQVPKYQDYEVIDLYPQASADKVDATALRANWMAGDDTDRSRRALKVTSVSEPMGQTLRVDGRFDGGGQITALATKAASSWSQSMASEGACQPDSYQVSGYWKSSGVKHAQLFDIELRWSGQSTGYVLSGFVGDGKGKSMNIQGVQKSKSVDSKWPISDLVVLRGDEAVPEGVEVLHKTCSGRSGSLVADTPAPHPMYLGLRRSSEAPEGGYVSDVCVIYGEIDAVPDHYICIRETPCGASANVNDGSNGIPMFICFRRDSATTSATSKAKCLMDLALMWTSGPTPDPVPTGFTKIQQTPLGMDANLNQGAGSTSIFLCFLKGQLSDVVRPMENDANGQYELTSAASNLPKVLSLAVVDTVQEARSFEGRFGPVVHGAMPGSVRGVVYHTTTSVGKTMIGFWSSDDVSVAGSVSARYPFELTTQGALDELKGWWSGYEPALATTGPATATTASNNTVGGPWTLYKDSYVRVAFKKDYGTEWKDGSLVASERMWRHDLDSMLSRFAATRTLGGDNAISCSTCEKKTESRAHSVVVKPPQHLILTLKRMYYDWTQQQTRKNLHDVQFPPLLTLPEVREEDEAVLYDARNQEEEATKKEMRKRQYGLYGVLVHSGMTANSGHYYSFCRESDESTQQLHLKDAPLAPWIKFNDTRVERSSWDELNKTMANSVSDSAYLLLYKKLSYEAPESNQDQGDGPQDMIITPPSSSEGDDEEAMLLAQAMALSMSAASLSSEAAAEYKSKESPIPAIDRSILETVEQSNTTFMKELLTATTSDMHADDLHTLQFLRKSMPVPLRSLLEKR